MTDFDKHLGAALAGRGYSLDKKLLAEAVAEANNRVAEARAEKFIAHALNAARKPMDPADTARYQELLDAAGVRSLTLEEFREIEAYDRNAFWRLDTGNHQNLLEEAVESIDNLQTVLADLQTGRTPSLR